MLSLFPLTPAPVLSGALLGGLGTPELVVILIVVLIIFGPQQLPKIGRAIGTSIRELKDAANSLSDEEEGSPRPSSQPSRPEGTVAAREPQAEARGSESPETAAPKEDPPQKMPAGPNVS